MINQKQVEKIADQIFSDAGILFDTECPNQLHDGAEYQVEIASKANAGDDWQPLFDAICKELVEQYGG